MRPLSVVVLLVGLVILLTRSCGGGDDRAARELETFDGPGYSVLMPGEPDRSGYITETEGGDAEVVSYAVNGIHRLFAVDTWTLPAGASRDLAVAPADVSRSVDGVVRDSSATTYRGLPAHDARITGSTTRNGDATTMFVRFVRAKDRMFMLQFSTDGADVRVPGGDYDRFVDSLRVK